MAQSDTRVTTRIRKKGRKFKPSRIGKIQPFRIYTANGPIKVTEAANFLKKEMVDLGEKVQFILLNDTPDAMSIGQLDIESGFDFVWKHGELPTLSHRDGRNITFDVEDYVPYWRVAGATAQSKTRKRGAAVAHRRPNGRVAPPGGRKSEEVESR